MLKEGDPLDRQVFFCWRKPMARSTFVYVTYIRATPEKLWSALTDREFMKQYWFGVHGESDLNDPYANESSHSAAE
jgi:uncharacterized protein YndB with AHSA1/START domain